MLGNIAIMLAGLATSAYSTAKIIQGPAIDYNLAVPILNDQIEVQPGPAALPQSAVPVMLDQNQGISSTVFAFPERPQSVDSINLAQSDGKVSKILLDQRYEIRTDGKLVSASFHGAKASEIFSWIEKQGVSFIVTDEHLKEKTVTMNLVNKPLGSAIDGLAAALGGHWEMQGDIRIFQTGTWPFQSGKVFSINQGSFQEPMVKMLQVPNPGLNGDIQIDPHVELGQVPLIGNFFKDVPAKGSARITVDPSRGKMSVKSLIDSLDDHQKQLLKEQGFLHSSDLREEQRKMVGISSDPLAGNAATYFFKEDDKSITIKAP